MYKKYGSKFIAVLLTLVMLVSLLPGMTTTSYAAVNQTLSGAQAGIKLPFKAEDIFGPEVNTAFVYFAEISDGVQLYVVNETTPYPSGEGSAGTEQFYFYAATAGTYTFSAGTDGLSSGDHAYTITVNVASANTAPTFKDAGAGSLSILQNAEATDIKSLLHISDTDSSQTLTWSQATGGAPSHGTLSFSSATASSGSNDVTPGGTITYTPAAGYTGNDSFTVQVSDGVATATRTINVTVASASNSAPTDISLSATSINENVSNNTMVGTLSTTDPDAGNTFTYTLVSGTGDSDNSALNISGDSLRMTNRPDYETKSSYSVRIRTTDQGTLSFEKAFTITVNDVNEAPTDISLSVTSINENVSNNTSVGTLTTTDPDAGNSFTYTLVSGVGDSDNSSFDLSGDSLRMTNIPDYEAKSSYSVRVRTTDQGALSFEKVFAITVNNINEAPVVTAPASITVMEDVASTLTGISFADIDAGSNAVTVTLSVNSGTLSAVEGGGVTVLGSGTSSLTLSGSIANINAFIAGTNVTFTTATNPISDVTLTVSVNDGGNTGFGGAQANSSTVMLSVTPVNDAPTLTATTLNPTFTENGSGVSLFSNATITNEDGQTLTTLVLTVSNVSDGNSEILTIDGTDVEMYNGNTVTTAGNGMTCSVSVAGATATVTVSNATAGLSTTAMQALINGITYRNTKETLTTGNRVVTLTSLQDNGGTANGGVDTASSALASTVTVNAPAPAVTGVNALTADGSYRAGSEIIVMANFSNPVTVVGTPQLTLETGATDRVVNYMGGSGSTILTFAYTVQAGDTSADLDYLSANSLTLNGGSIQYSGTNAVLTLPAPGAAGSLGANKAIVIDTVAPAAPSTPDLSAASDTGSSSTDNITSDTTPTFTGTAEAGSTVMVISSVSGALGTATAGGSGNWIFTASILDVGAHAITATATDAAGNKSVASAGLAITIDPLAPQTISVSNSSVTEGNSGTSTLTFTVTLTPVGVVPVTVDYSTVDGTAAAGTDYIAASGTLSFAPGETSKTISVSIMGDTVFEPDETILLNLSNLSYGTISQSQGVGTILNDDNTVPGANSTINLTTASFDKKPSSQVDVPITMTLNGNTLTSIKNGTTSLTLGTDYTVSGSAVTILKNYLAGRATGTVTLTFNFSSGNSQTLSISVSDSTSSGGSGGSSGGSSGSSGGSSSGSSSSTTSSTPVIVNGETQTAGNATTSTVSGQTVTTVTVDTAKLEKVLEAKGQEVTVTIPVTSNSDVAVAGLTGQMIKQMENKEATLEVKTGVATYILPASEINIDSVSKQLGQDIKLSDIKVEIKIAKPSANSIKVVENASKVGSFAVMVPSVEFQINCTYNGKNVDVRSFNSYVERTISIPDGIDSSKITTGIVINPDGTTRSVPTQVIQINGKYYAKINSLTNSTYAVIWHPVTFNDVTNHWAKDAVNNMGSRMVVTGIGNGNYNPNSDITRAEFAAIIVRALGLPTGNGDNKFRDVKSSDWFFGYVETASQYGIINGYNETTFSPGDKITREQAMTMIARAMKLTGLSGDMTDSEMAALLAGYTDSMSASGFAKTSLATCLKTGVVSGTTSSTLSPKSNISRAEVAVIVQRLLQKSKLI